MNNRDDELEYETTCPFCGGVCWRFDIELVKMSIKLQQRGECPFCSVVYPLTEENTKLIKHRNRKR